MKFLKAPLFFILFLSVSCGVNTDKPVYPLFTLFTPVQSPALVSVTPVAIWTTSTQYKIEFDIRYYITNQEPEFQGYNLITSTTSTSAQNTGFGSVTYLPNGVEPSFEHIGAKPSTASKDLITQRVINYKAAPSPLPFQLCEQYYFRLQALTSNGIRSNYGNQISACAIMDINLCSKGTVCNP